MSYKWQPDFVITVNGTDVTKLVQSWRLNDVEDGISNLNVVLVNKDLNVGPTLEAFESSVNSSVTIRFGYQGDLSDPVTMEIKEYTESYSVQGARIEFTAYDCSERLTGVMSRGLGADDDLVELIKSIGDGVKPPIKVETGEMENPKRPEDFKNPIPNERLYDFMRRALLAVGNPKKKKAGSTGKAKGTKAIKKQAKGQNPPGFNGKTSEGLMVAPGPHVTAKDIQDAAKNALSQLTDTAASNTILAAITTLGVKDLKAKTVITVKNVGQGSGDWYVKGVTHAWGVTQGYTCNADLLDAGSGEAPMVTYAEIYKKDTVYSGPRKIDQGSSHTFTFGRDDKRIIHFKWTERVQPARAGGEKGNLEHIPIDNITELQVEHDGPSQSIPGNDEVGAPF